MAEGTAVTLPEQGFIRDYVECFEPTTEAPRQYHVATALAVLSMAIGREAWIELAGRLHLNLYVLILGPSTQTRKSTAMRFGEVTLRRAAKLHPGSFEESWLLPSGTLSGEAVIERLDRENRAMLRLDEFGRLLAGAKAKSYMADLKEVFTEVYGCWSPGRLTREKSTQAGPCFLTITAVTTRSRFEEEITAEDVASGFLGRFLLIYAHAADKVLAFPPAPDPERVTGLVNRLARIAKDVKGEITFAPAARDAIAEWYESRRAALASGEDAELALPIFFRLDAIVRKLAALMEASAHPRPDLVVREQAARDAIAYADFTLKQIRDRLLDGVLGELARKMRRLEDAIHTTPGITKSKLQKVTNIQEPEFTRLATLLADEGEIKILNGQGRNKKGEIGRAHV